ncbi:MAG: HlyC/CorC family transporter [Gammaproteobacteria bacterium]|nr:HlyC/CorC family transporter [Gammaproteobacteria bacterium]MCH9716047.1 HlyC/CorC family transporter [Gammaproteobacteria bacterium]MCH9763484.1 HlyC/CorC family transporter [Gammaproteobacteria bacterium]
MSTPLSTLVIALFFLIVLAAFFSAAETSMMAINRYRLRYLVKKNHKQAKRVSRLLKHPDRLLGVVLIGSTFSNVVASMLSTLIGGRVYGNFGVGIAAGLLTLVILVFAEMAPKTLAALYTERVAFACAWPLLILQKLFFPLVRLIGWIANAILRCFGISLNYTQKEALSSDELRSVVHEAGGLLPVEHQSMLISLLDLERACVEDIMVPKNEITGIDLDLPWETVLASLETIQHTRLPVYRGNIENLLGIVHLRRLLNLRLEGVLDADTLLQAVDAPYFIPEATLLNVQILNFQKMKRRSGFVVDEYGDLQGLVTMEDILEEVVGEFTTDIAALSNDISPQIDGSSIIDASITLRHLNRALGWQLPAMGPRTLSGLIIEHLGYIPPSECCLMINNYQVEVLKVGGHKVKSVRVIQLTKHRAETH